MSPDAAGLALHIALFAVAGFIAQMIDGTLGMAYGVSATTLLLSFGVPPAFASASVHTAEVVTTAFSGYHHWRAGNVLGTFVRKLLVPGVLGGITGAYLLTAIPGDAIKPFIAAYLLVMGVIILAKAWRRSVHVGSEKHLVPLGLAGGFFDAIGGGGWGPIVVGTLLARGNEPRTTIGSVNFAEFFVTFATSATFLFTIGITNWPAIVGLAIGGAIAAPIAARLAGRIPARPMMFSVGALVILLSIRTIFLALR
ncbi:MAG: sulfite exporter TauE/SafE family protein [Acidobacteria bacterium]|nr:sulfite exporter TauE/SafE family protein [Acidobacteriota bacterium]MBV9476884.1 sulfite exporter TauE/SafE family protein [Acidobacteriota bacterium]